MSSTLEHCELKELRKILRRTQTIQRISKITFGHKWETRIEACNRLMEGYGVEAIRGEWQNGYWCDIEYVNVRDSYALTIIHERGSGFSESGRFFISSVADYIEKSWKKLGIL